jgi:hypothetical protein
LLALTLLATGCRSLSARGTASEMCITNVRYR